MIHLVSDLFRCPSAAPGYKNLVATENKKIYLSFVVENILASCGSATCGTVARKQNGQFRLEWMLPSELCSRCDQAEYSGVFIKSVGALKMTLLYNKIYYINSYNL